MKTVKEAVKKLSLKELDNVLATNMLENFKNAKKDSWVSCFMSVLPYNATTKKAYKGINAILLGLFTDLYGYKSHAWLTFNQAKDRNICVNKGAKSAKAIKFAIMLRNTLDPHAPLKKLEDVKKEELENYVKVPLINHFNVFNICQTNANISDYESNLEHDTKLINAKVLSLINQFKVKINYVESGCPRTDGKNNIYILKTGQCTDMAEYNITLLHELSHVIYRRVLDINTNYRNKKNRAFEEMAVEFASLFIADFLKIEYKNKNSFNYISSWSKAVNEDNSIIRLSCNLATKILDEIAKVYKPTAIQEELF